MFTHSRADTEPRLHTDAASAVAAQPAAQDVTEPLTPMSTDSGPVAQLNVRAPAATKRHALEQENMTITSLAAVIERGIQQQAVAY